MVFVCGGDCWGILGLLGWLWLGAGVKSGKSLTALHVFHQPCRNCTVGVPPDRN